MEKIWFISIQDVVTGPLTTEDADRKIGLSAFANHAMVWWRGQPKWVQHTYWRENRSEILRNIEIQSYGSEQYYLNVGAETKGPYSTKEVENLLAQIKDLNSIYLWSEEQKRWRSVYEFSHLCERLNIARRAHPRVPMKGTATLIKDNQELAAEITSVSMGGFGIKLAKPGNLVGVFTVAIRSPVLFSVVKTRAEVAYSKGENVGFKFLTLSVENQAAIVQYIRTFEEKEQAAA